MTHVVDIKVVRHVAVDEAGGVDEVNVGEVARHGDGHGGLQVPVNDGGGVDDGDGMDGVDGVDGV